MRLTKQQIAEFRKTVYNYFSLHRRTLPWRFVDDSYKVWVSEIMLQQTQVDRVIPKFNQFIDTFPDVHALAAAPLSKVIQQWQGLGYNRRALMLHKAAQKISQYFKQIPDEPKTLEALPGIGPATARSIAAFAFNKPVVFIETNIRSVFIHHFFTKQNVHDTEIEPLVEQTLDREQPARWYSALMDYGSMLKKKHTNPSRKSIHHVKQTPFEGSDRQIRGRILKLLSESEYTINQLAAKIGDKTRIEYNVKKLHHEGFLKKGKKITLTS